MFTLLTDKDMPEIRRQLLASGLGFIATFDVCLTAWMIEEARMPGQQYADPLLPCAYVAGLGAQAGLIVYFSAGIVSAVARKHRRRNR